jgi:hypothetical protein
MKAFLVWLSLTLCASIPSSSQAPSRVCAPLPDFYAAAEKHDGHLRAIVVTDSKSLQEFSGVYTGNTGEKINPDFAVLLWFSRGASMLALGTEEHGVCWVAPVAVPYEVLSRYFSTAA